ncbi:MAG: ATPase, T2SS/T4P/T4SS family, partial [Oscillospiraceae bacterium]
MPELYELCGVVEHIVFHNEKNQYTVAELNSGDELVTVVGILPYISEGEEVKIIGEWTNHATFGNQFKAQTFEKSKPKTTSAMLKYLSGGAVKGIGPATARRIVDAFGENTIDVIENEPDRLAQIKGISKAKAQEISAEIKRIYGIRELMLYLSAFGVKPEEAVRVWKIYGGAALETIRDNPYCMCGEFIAIDFAIADAVAASMEKPGEEVGRISAGLIYVLRHNANNGHTCIPVEKLVKTASRMLGVDIPAVQDVVVTMCENGDVICQTLCDRDFLFLPKYYQAEQYIAERFNLMLHYPPRSIVGIEDEIREIEEQEGVTYAEKQKEAIRAALDKGLLILTGGPGTGKTTTLNAIIHILKMKGEVVFLAAPTGRAAKRMSDLTNEEAKTIHRMLQVDWDEN